MKNWLSKFLLGSLLLAPVVANAAYDTLFFDLGQGDVMSHYRLGIGETAAGDEGEQVTSMYYLGYLSSDDEIKVGSNNLGEQDVKVLTLGAGGFGYLENPQENGGAEFDFELSKTTIDELDYDRTSIGFRTQLFIPIAAGLQANLGFNLRPFFLAADWDDQAELEYEYQFGIEYAFTGNIALYGHHRYFGVIDDDEKEVKLAEGLLFGIRGRF